MNKLDREILIQFDGKIFIIGCGAVAQCTIPLILKNIRIQPKNILVIDPIDKRNFIENTLQENVHFELQQITKDNFNYVLSQYLESGDICIDLANETDTYDILNWCQTHNVMFLNTCFNNWPNSEHISFNQLFLSLTTLQNLYKKGPTAILAHGANPGLVSSFVKQALVDLAEYMLIKKRENKKNIEQALKDENFSNLAQQLDINVIHITEKDTQVIGNYDTAKKFLNTWSVIEFLKECTANAEFPWGSHEKVIPQNAKVLDGNIFFKTLGFNLQIKSWIPYEEFYGMVIPHEETFTIADYLSIKNKNSYDYRPTTLFVYDPCPVAKKTLEKMKQSDLSYKTNEHEYVIKNEIIDGIDKVGCLIMNNNVAWWTGSIVSIQESNHLIPGQNGTVMQVAAGILAALHFMINNQKEGILFPEQLNYKEIISIAKPYLGNFISEHTDWLPSKNLNFVDF